MSYEFLSHTADVKFKVTSASWNEMFVDAANALNEVMLGKIKIEENEERSFEVEGKDLETLLHNLLEEFLFLLDAEDFVLSKIKSLEFDREKLKIKISVVGDAGLNYEFTNDVKAITFNDMYVKENEGKFECQVVLDV